MPKCLNCGAELPSFVGGKLPFRVSCERCGVDLHCCKNCKYYKIGLPNDCSVPGTEFIADREKNNFCEDFAVLDKVPQPKNSLLRKRFDDLFK